MTEAWLEAAASAKRIDWYIVLASGPKYVARTLLLSVGLFAVAATLTLPLTVLARAAFEDVLKKGGAASGIGGLHAFVHPSGMWKTTAFVAVYHTYQSFAQLASRWSVMGVAWQGWQRACGKPLLITIIAMFWYIISCLGSTILVNYGMMSAQVRLITVVLGLTLPNFLMVLSVAKLSSRIMTWGSVLKVVTMSTCLEWGCALLIQVSLLAYYSTENTFARVAIRLIPMVVRRIWLHGNCLLSLRYHISNEENRFLLMVLPIGSTAVAGTCMQLVSSSYQVVTMSLLMMVLEVIDALVLLSGATQLELSRLWFMRVWRRSSKTFRAVFPSAQGAEGVGGSEGDGEDEAVETRIRKAREEHAHEQRKPLLVAAAVQVCVAEANSLMLVSMQLLMLPIDVGGTALGVPGNLVIKRLLISLFFELLGDGIVATVSTVLSQVWPDKFCSATTARQGLRLNTLSMAIAYSIIAITSVEYVALFLSSLCVYPDSTNLEGFVLETCS
mmetsp:Transcript_50978/g.165033  ORF Transcript_50978/g.165033 Transcript_50978/m.165033 type:complete len:500 (+) Transcript_50978:72-1571(+)|eukprot:CAMPEP_0203840280 /NCGR_PEP_ID=MMETSP0359-20131031/678_1 /ASSEMBLY_ACC=CAM_ASM_000338 /TAXON_ID=268821 /ORGANISM="Scrippsiella Hangoei, Strain SHTV-5" /LENGTH=499 /DNA_ID=CAMNT_0050754465 /DNA_START=26 /DNA_END=1525 /DNA_ORIENTATION=+